MNISVVRSSLDEVRILRRTAAQAHKCSHEQRSTTGLSELWYEVVYNPNTFFLSLKQRTVVKAVEDAMHQIVCSRGFR